MTEVILNLFTTDVHDMPGMVLVIGLIISYGIALDLKEFIIK